MNRTALATPEQNANVLKQTPRLLIVDDHVSTLQSLQALLRINGYSIDLARSGGEALSKLAENSYDLLLLDLHMPGIDGLDILGHLRQSGQGLETLVISGETGFSAVRQAMRLGAYDFIRKPYSPQDLLETVSQALQQLTDKRHLRKADTVCQASERMHRFIVNRSPDFIYLLDAHGHFTYVNDMAEKLLGYKRHELLGAHFSKLIHPNNAAAVNCFFSEQRAGERATRSMEMRLLANGRDDQPSGLENDELIVELNATGIYKTDPDGSRKFAGTLGSARDITERKRSQERISYQAYHDLLTQLPNRLLFNDRLQQAIAHGDRNDSRFALMFMDLDRFKLINDSLGHIMGDRVLQLVAERILGCLRLEDTLCRFGGDEFALLLATVDDREGAAAVADKILRAVRQPFIVKEHQLQLSLSIGIALFPDAGSSPETLIQSADLAMYQVKDQGKDSYCFYQQDIRDGFSHLTYERELETALEKRQFQVFFQPRVDPNSHTIIGMEALLRWQHPQRGLLYPGDFLAAAEDSKLIVPIGHWVLDEVCCEMQRWLDQGLHGIRVSLNISSVQLEDERFVDRFIARIKESGLPVELFEIELSERGGLLVQEALIDRLKTLCRFGITVAIDDFGSGYSSFNYLRNIDVSTLKIDRWFVRDIESDRQHTGLVEGIVMMAKGMNLNLVAEGVETLQQLEYLRCLGCQEVQGFLYGKAVPGPVASNMLQQRTPSGGHFDLLQ